ncbi:MAG: hypothetical protein GW893_06990 [Armatimonadetes bacterium]|nr:hypothetical protein [Armatimonadota bacterium]PIU60905.1 MAG: hypothetical protein COS85_22260 [Armatimonadetes bacterium CG07_land_8_20_14_0_80_59_28]PIX42445.1 MAG: hypothetical protein COZ56_09395 [Armatimonadetes bacterium CG_4_8_14_3_um_filter_58_9]PIY44163.1 MAG: hypothetical protein COZ05_08955 [Armatimonadetes bacterium CG_4_10_14_3_um_filter_59_10]
MHSCRHCLLIRAIVVVMWLGVSASPSVGNGGDLWFPFDSDTDFGGWTAQNFEQVEAKGGSLTGRTKFDCMLASPALRIAAADYPELVFRAKSSISGGGEVFFRHPDDQMSDQRQINHTLIGDGQFHLYRVNLATHPEWKGAIAQIRLDLLNPAGADIALDFVGFRRVPGLALFNGGAEMLESSLPLQWTPVGPAATVTTDSPREGQRALRVDCPSPNDSSWQADPVDLSFLGRHVVSGFARGVAPRVDVDFITLAGEPLKGESLRKDFPAPGDTYQAFRFEFKSPRLAAWASIRLTTAASGRGDFDDVNIRQLEKGAIVDGVSATPTWNAAWIWHPQTSKDDHTTAYFRKAFVVNARNRITTAQMQISADDHFRLFVNGREVANTFGVLDAWKTPKALDLKPFLRDGANLIAVEATDDTSAQGLLAEVSLLLDDGTVTEIATDDSWQTTTVPVEGWNSHLDAPGEWLPAHVINRAPGGPWGALPYAFLGGGASISARSFKATFQQNGRLLVSLAVTPLTKVYREVRGEITFSRNGKVLGRRRVSAFRIPTNASVGSALTWAAEVPLTYGVGDGAVDIALGLVGGQWKEDAPTATVMLKAPAPPKRFATAKVVPGVSGPQLVVNGKPTNPTQTWFIKFDELHAQNARRAGVKIWTVECDDMGWKGPGKYDYSEIDERMHALLDVDPDVWLILSYDLSSRFQVWWIDSHPEALCRTESGDEKIGDYAGARRRVPSFASPVWRQAFLDAQTRLIRHLAESPFASRIIGFQPCNGISYEWFLWGAQSAELVDYSEAGVADFRRWLKEKYQIDAALQAAWRNPTVSLATASIPIDAERRAPGSGIFFTPGAQQHIIDYNRHQHDQVIDTILLFARNIKEETADRSIVGTFYGYVAYLPETPGFCQSSGHFNLTRMLQQPEIDFLMAPTAYSWRELGGALGCMTAFGSFAVNNKLWFNEADTRTHWSHQDRYGRPADLTGSVQMQRREEALALTTNCAVQWYDFSLGWMWGDERLAVAADALRRVDIACRDRNPLPRRDTLAVIMDDRQMGRLDIFELPFRLRLIYEQRRWLQQCGVPWTMYLLSDLERHPELKEHRAFLFLNLFHLDAAGRALIESLKGDGRVLVFMTSAGYVDNDFSTRRASQVVGIQVEELPEKDSPALICRIGSSKSKVTAALQEGFTYGSPQKSIPGFVIRDSDATVLGTYDGTDLPALAVREHARWTSVLSLAPGLPPGLLRGIARVAGLHVYSESNDPIYIGNGLVGIHAATSGEKVVSLPRPATVMEMFSGEALGRRPAEIRRPMRMGETLLFRVNDAR